MQKINEELVTALESWFDGRDMLNTDIYKSQLVEKLNALIDEKIRLALEAHKAKPLKK